MVACDSPPTRSAADDRPAAMSSPMRSRSAAGQCPPIGDVLDRGDGSVNRAASSPGRSSYDQLTVFTAWIASIREPRAGDPLSASAARAASVIRSSGSRGPAGSPARPERTSPTPTITGIRAGSMESPLV